MSRIQNIVIEQPYEEDHRFLDVPVDVEPNEPSPCGQTEHAIITLCLLGVDFKVTLNGNDAHLHYSTPVFGKIFSEEDVIILEWGQIAYELTRNHGKFFTAIYNDDEEPTEDNFPF